MAEPSPSPSLPSTADEVPYAPVSWLAVGSVGVAAVFVLLLVVLGFDAFRAKKPLIMPQLLLLAGFAVVLSFAARRVIRTSEGTRTGEKLTDIAWWGAIVAGIVYAAYWFAIEYSIRRDAKEEVQKWVGMVLKQEISPAFHRTLEPGRRTKLRPDDEAKMTAEFREPIMAFRQIDLVRVALRSPGECEFVPGGLRDWVSKPAGVECVFTGTVKSPEGSFPVHIPMKGTEGVAIDGVPVGRQWQIVPQQNGFVQLERVALTKYGWFLFDLEQQADAVAQAFVNLAGSGGQAYAYQAFVKEGSTPEAWSKLGEGMNARIATIGGLTLGLPFTRDYADYIAEKMLRLPGGGDPAADQKKRFLASWYSTGVVPKGARLRNTPDVHNFITAVKDDGGKIVRVEVRVPVELPSPSIEADMAAARGRLVLATTDPEVIEKVNRFRESGANPDQPEKARPAEIGKKMYHWRVTRVESDMYRFAPRPPMDGPGGGPPGGMPGH